MPPNGDDRRIRFIVGVTCIAVSFLVYPAYLTIPFLPLSAATKLNITLFASVASWTAFGIGFYLSGQKGYEWLKARLRR